MHYIIHNYVFIIFKYYSNIFIFLYFFTLPSLANYLAIDCFIITFNKNQLLKENVQTDFKIGHNFKAIRKGMSGSVDISTYMSLFFVLKTKHWEAEYESRKEKMGKAFFNLTNGVDSF